MTDAGGPGAWGTAWLGYRADGYRSRARPARAGAEASLRAGLRWWLRRW